MQKTEFHRRRIFPGPSGGRGNGMRRSGESAGQRVAGGKAAGRQGGKAAGGRLQGSGRQDGGRQDGGRQGGKVAGRQSGRAAKWQGGKVAGRQGGKVAGRQSGRTAKWQGGKVAGRRSAGRQKKRGLRFFLKKIKNHFVRKSYVPASRRQGRVIAADRSGAPPAQTKKTGETIGPARFSTGIPTAGSRRTAKKRTEKRPGICKRPMHRFSIRCSDTGKGAILFARPPLVK